MLQRIHERARGWLAWIIISLVAFTFVIWGTQSIFAGFGHSDSVATVNGTDISNAQLNAAYQRLRQQEQLQLGSSFDLSPTHDILLKRTALEQLILSFVLTHAADKQGFRFSQIQAADVVRSLPIFQENGQYSPALLAQMLSNFGYTEQGFLQNVQNAMLINEPRIGIANSDFVLPSEADKLLRLVQQKRDIKYIILPAAKFTSTTAPTEQAIQAYYQTHKQQFQVPELVSIDYLELSLADIKTTIQPTDKELEAYYLANRNNFPQAYEKSKTLVRDAFVQQKAEQAFADRSEKLGNITYTNPSSLTIAAKELKLPVKTSSSFSSNGSKDGITANPKVVAAAHQPDVLNQGNNSNVIEVGPQQVVVLRIHKHQPAMTQALTTVKAEIIKILQAQQTQRNAEQKGKQLIQQLQAGRPIDSELQTLGIKWNSQNAVGRFDKTVPGPILLNVFSTQPSDTNHHYPNGFTLPNGDYAILSVTAVSDSTKIAITSAELQQFQDQLAQGLGKLSYESYVNNLQQQAKIKIKE